MHSAHFDSQVLYTYLTVYCMDVDDQADDQLIVAETEHWNIERDRGIDRKTEHVFLRRRYYTHRRSTTNGLRTRVSFSFVDDPVPGNADRIHSLKTRAYIVLTFERRTRFPQEVFRFTQTHKQTRRMFCRG